MGPPDTTGCNTLRASNARLGENSDVVEFGFEGRVLKARQGESLLAALVASGELRLRLTEDGRYRGPFCGMGVCQECLLEVDGRCSRRACMTSVGPGMSVRRQANRVAAFPGPKDTSTRQQNHATSALTPQVAVIGGGPGGMAAAAMSAQSGADVLLIDERAQLGGQFFKQPLPADDLRVEDFDDRQYSDGRRLIGKVNASGARLLTAARVVGAYEPMDLVVEVGSGTRLVRPQVLIVATGAYEVSYPFDGWTLPGVMTTGAAQTLLRSYRVLPGRRILVAGNGPLNFQFATELLTSGADVVAVVEAALRPGLPATGSVIGMMKSDPRLAVRGAGYLSFLARRRVPLVYGHRIARIESLGDGDRPHFLATTECLASRDGPGREFEADAVCLGYGFRPSNEILRALGCAHAVNPGSGMMETVRRDDCTTSRENVLAIGDCTRLGGAAAAQAEGIVAAATALNALGVLAPPGFGKTLKAARARLRRQRGFQQSLWNLFRPAGRLLAGLDETALVCRCEGLSLAELSSALTNQSRPSLASIKRLTRVGMGRCQGRYCGVTLERILTERQDSPLEEGDLWAPRPPISQTRIADLAGLEFPKHGTNE